MIVRDPSRAASDDEREFAGSIDELAHAIDAHASMGTGHLIVQLLPHDERSLDRLTEAVEKRTN
jgi:hypothetical protein